jgi:hypothetical protein
LRRRERRCGAARVLGAAARLILRGAAAAALWLPALVLAAWLLGRVASDRWSWSQWLAWIPTPAALVACAAGALAGRGAVRRRVQAAGPRAGAGRRGFRGAVLARPARAWGVLLAATGAWFAFVEHRLHRLGGTSPQGLRLLHWNASVADPRRAPPFRAALAPVAADVLIITDGDGLLLDPSFREWAQGRGRVLTMGPFTAITDRPIHEWRHIAAAGDIHVVRLVVEGTTGGPVSLWLMDLPSNPRVPRMALMRRVRRMLETVDAQWPDVIIGDLNVSRGAASLRHLAPGYRDAFDLAGRGYGATFPRAFPLYHIDQALAAPGVRVEGYEALDFGIGRHLAQRVVLRDGRG